MNRSQISVFAQRGPRPTLAKSPSFLAEPFVQCEHSYSQEEVLFACVARGLGLTAACVLRIHLPNHALHFVPMLILTETMRFALFTFGRVAGSKTCVVLSV